MDREDYLDDIEMVSRSIAHAATSLQFLGVKDLKIVLSHLDRAANKIEKAPRTYKYGLHERYR